MTGGVLEIVMIAMFYLSQTGGYSYFVDFNYYIQELFSYFRVLVIETYFVVSFVCIFYESC